MTSREQIRVPPQPGRPAPHRAPLLRFGRWWWAFPAIVVIVAIHYVAPMVGGFFAFTDWSGIGRWNFVGFDNFADIVEDRTMSGAIRNTLLLAFAAVLVSNVVGLLLALALNRTLKSRFVLRTLLFMPVVLSPLAVSYVWRFIFDYEGPLNGLLGLVGLESLQRVWLADPTWSIWAVLVVVVWQDTGLIMVIYLAGLAGVPVEVEEAAALDGAGAWGRFRHVVLPAIRPAVAIATTLGIIQSLRIFDQILALTGGGPAGATATLATEVYKRAFSLGQFGLGAALALILTALILVFALLQQYLTRDRSIEKA